MTSMTKCQLGTITSFSFNLLSQRWRIIASPLVFVSAAQCSESVIGMRTSLLLGALCPRQSRPSRSSPSSPCCAAGSHWPAPLRMVVMVCVCQCSSLSCPHLPPLSGCGAIKSLMFFSLLHIVSPLSFFESESEVVQSCPTLCDPVAH